MEPFVTLYVAAVPNLTCVVCEAPIELDDPITGRGVNGWRHAGCEGEQIFETRYKKDEKAADDLLKKQAEKDCGDF